ncbi:hypothetical protein CGZ80_21180 [Rhodopirellula sp. MGV]|nr:hypothetical protein CGZ80_21180 [Rhodopirellula sp. MGV]PNY36331.1 hypothetical protein C2E31_13660 [Rhodopirellula baltica]PNY37709.1 hypothetical protein C2E31_06110 [Rhodopirellula baltica]
MNSDGRHPIAPSRPSTKLLNHEVREEHEDGMDMTTGVGHCGHNLPRERRHSPRHGERVCSKSIDEDSVPSRARNSSRRPHDDSLQFAADDKFTRSAVRRVTSSELAVGTSGVGLPSIVLSNAVLVVAIGCQASACIHWPSRPRTDQTATSRAINRKLRFREIGWARFERNNQQF